MKINTLRKKVSKYADDIETIVRKVGGFSR
jgi:hypothetical protein